MYTQLRKNKNNNLLQRCGMHNKATVTQITWLIVSTFHFILSLFMDYLLNMSSYNLGTRGKKKLTIMKISIFIVLWRKRLHGQGWERSTSCQLLGNSHCYWYVKTRKAQQLIKLFNSSDLFHDGTFGGSVLTSNRKHIPVESILEMLVTLKFITRHQKAEASSGCLPSSHFFYFQSSKNLTILPHVCATLAPQTFLTAFLPQMAKHAFISFQQRKTATM